MYKRISSRLAAFALSGLFLTGCASSPSRPSGASSSEQAAPGGLSLLEEINREHQAIVKPQVDFSAYIGQYSDDPFDIVPYMVDTSVGYGQDFNGDQPLTMEQVQEDLDVLFRTLQTTYGAYYYFGGDQAFNQAKEAVLQDCRAAEELNCNTLVSLLLDHLAFIQDAHFRIVGMTFSQPLVPFYYREAVFEKTAEGYQAASDGRRVVSADGWDDLDQLLRRSIGEDGDVVYLPVVLGEFDGDPDKRPADVTLRYDDGSAQTLTASPYESYYDESEDTVRLTEHQGIPVLFVRNMGFDEAKDDTLGKEFLSYARQLKDEPVVILDLRSNGGGNGVLPFKWLKEYTGQDVTTNYASIQYWSEEDMRSYTANRENPYYVSYESMTELAGYEPISEQYTKVNAQPDAFADNDNLLIILTGKNTGSAAETFVDMAHNVRNTLMIGENTYGVLVSNAYTVIALPNSRTPVQLGSDLSIFPEGGYFQEFVGFQPDFWVSGGDAEELAVRLAQRLLQESD